MLAMIETDKLAAERIIAATPRVAERRSVRAGVAPAPARRICRAGKGARPAGNFHRSREAPFGIARSRTVCSGRPASARPRLRTSSRENGVNQRQTSGPVLERAGDLAALLTNLEATTYCSSTRSIACRRSSRKFCIQRLEDYQIDIMIGEGPAARSVKLDLQPFTLVGATTRAGMLTNPLRDRFGHRRAARVL